MTDLRDEHGVGSVLALGVIAGLAVTVLFVGSLSAVLQGERRAATAADASALAAADTASGLVSGIPCTVAAAVAAEDGATVTRCRQRGDTVTVTVSRVALGLSIEVSARAGQPRESAAAGS